MARALLLSSTVAVVFGFCFLTPCAAQENVVFRRGDVNADGVVDVADAAYLKEWLLGGGPEPSCLDAADADDSGGTAEAMIVDAVRILNYLYLGGPPTSSPGPVQCGPDPTDDSTSCLSYAACGEVPSKPDDPRFELRFAPAGPVEATELSEEADVAVELCTNEAVQGWSLSFVVSGPACAIHGATTAGTVGGLANVPPGLRDREASFEKTELIDPDRNGGATGVVSMAYLSFFVGTSLPPGGGTGVDCASPVPLVRVALESTEPTEPGACFPCTFAFQDGLGGSGEAVANRVVVGGESFRPMTNSVATVEVCNRPNILFHLDDATGSPGAPVGVPFTVRSDRETSGFSYSIDFDETILEGTGTRKLWQETGGGPPYEFERFEINNTDGFLVGAAILSFSDTGAVIPPNEDVALLEFDLLVRPEAPIGETSLVFEDGGQGTGGAVRNKLIAGGQEITPETAGSFVFVGALLRIVPDASPFRRGDANGSDVIDVSDATATLNYLFLGGTRPRCHDAADADDNGEINVTDPIYFLNFLFLGGDPLPPPNAATGPGLDPTPDRLGCLTIGPTD
jgi:hypothetical protein